MFGRIVAACAVAVGLALGPTIAAHAMPATSPVGYRELPFAWGRMSFQITGTGTYVTGFRGSVVNDTLSVYFAARTGIMYNGRWDWVSGWRVVAPCYYWPVNWFPGRTGQGAFFPAGNYSMVVQVVDGAYWGETWITWNVHR